MGGQLEWLLGFSDRALATSGEGLALARELAHPLSLQLALLYRSSLHLDRGEPDEALQELEAAEVLVAEQRLGFVLEPRFLRGGVLVRQGAVDDGIAVLREGLDTALGRRISRPYGLLLLAEGLIRRSEFIEALAAVGEGFQSIESTGQHQWEAELYRLKALTLLGQNDLQESRHALTEALQVSRNQQAIVYELRAATRLARLMAELGRRADAHDLLGTLYGRFTEGFDTGDLKEAKALLDELR